MSILTEDRIKSAALRYLKAYYRQRPRSGSTTASLDKQASGGIIADGFIQFPREDGTVFTATFEATSHLTKNEVVYQIQRYLLNWDSVALAFVATSLLFSFSHINSWITVGDIGTWGILGLLALAMGVSYLISRNILRLVNRYFYIYAIEQFKQYHADEQWIAIGEDVFPKPNSRFLKELKRQCVKNGVGLLKIQMDETAILLITPARHDLFGGNRKLLEFASQNKYLANPTQRLTESSKRLLEKTGITLPTDRFKRHYYNQLAVIGLCLVLISGIFTLEYQKAKIIYIDGAEYRELMDSIRLSGETESSDYLIDTPFITAPFPIVDLPAPVYPNSDKMEDPLPKSEKYIDPRPTAPREVGDFPSGDTLITITDCNRFLNLEKNSFLIVESNYGSLKIARERLQYFQERDMVAGFVWMGCFQASRQDYALFFGSIFTNLSEAKELKQMIESEHQDEFDTVLSLQIVSLDIQ